MKLLKQKTSGEIYVWDAELAKRSDMEEYVKPAAIEVTEVEEIVVKEPKPKKKAK